MKFVIPKALFLILGVILIWVSVNVTNCTDGRGWSVRECFAV